MAADPAAVPVPFDLSPWDGTVDPAYPLTPFQKAQVLSAFPRHARIGDVRPHRHWDGRLTFPVYVRVIGVSGKTGQAGEQTVLLRMERYRGGVENEASVLPVLMRLGLPVPQLLAGPAIDPEFPDRGAVSVLSMLPGTDLQHLSSPASAERVAALGAFIFDGVGMLHMATAAVRDDPAGAATPTVTLEAELQAIQSRGGPWLTEDTFRDAIARLLPLAAAEGERTPLVFSNGDYNAGNFLAAGPSDPAGVDASGSADGWRLTGIVDFARARFEDPYYGFAKYWTYDMQPFHGAGVIGRGLASWGVTDQQFAVRLAIRCLWTLQREVPVTDGAERLGRYRENLRILLRRSLAQLGR